MKNSLFLIFSLLLHTNQVYGQIDSSRVVRVMSFNILHGATTKGDFDLDIIAKVIRQADPDLVSLQEVDFKTKRAKRYDLATEIGWRTQMAPLFGKAMNYDGGGYGEGILSRWPIISSRNIALPYTVNKEPRAALEVTIGIASGDTIQFIGTHLDHTREDSSRLLQVRKINEVFSKNQYPTILTGDLNAQPGSREIEILEDLWTASYHGTTNIFTFPSSGAVKKIDYVLFRHEQEWQVLEVEIICDEIASDHCALLVTLLLN